MNAAILIFGTLGGALAGVAGSIAVAVIRTMQKEHGRLSLGRAIRQLAH